MLRKFSKKNPSAKQSKRGVILVTILFILAISFILITAAMLMTKATRDRLYTRAESSQARLTATAVAQAFAQAYSNHTLSEGAMSTILSSNRAGNPLTITASPDLPGMTSAADNCTTLTVVPNTTLSGAYWIDFTTTIGTEKSTVRLSYKPHESGTHSATFQHQLQLGSGGRLENVMVGIDLAQYNAGNTVRYAADNNTVLSLGGSTSVGGQTHIASTLYCDSSLGSGSNTQMYGDVIFFGDHGGLNLHGLSGSSFHGNNGANLYFLETDGSVVWYDNNRIDDTNLSSYAHNNDWICGFNNVVFRNSDMYVPLDQAVQQSQHYYRDGSSSISFGNSQAESAFTSRELDYSLVESAANTYWQTIEDGNYNETNLALRPNGQKYSEFLTASNIDGVVASDPSLATGTNFQAYTSGSDVNLPKGTYILGGTGASSLNIGKNHKILCNLNDGPYIFYVKGDFSFISGTFEFYNGDIADANHTAYFIICEGASLRFTPSDPDGIGTGIVSANCFAPGADHTRANIDQSSKPSVLVIGAGCSESGSCIPNAGTDHVTDGQIYYDCNANQCILTAYVNLLPKETPTTTAPSVGYGSVCAGRAGDGIIFYGRIYCNQVYGGDSSYMIMPYCPAPNDNSGGNSTPVDNAYDIYGFSYYTA